MNFIERQSWFATMPDDVRRALKNVPVMNSLREHRNAAFQLQGQYDGAMSEDCKRSFASDYQALSDLITYLE